VQRKISAGILQQYFIMPVPGKIQTHVLRVLLGKRLVRKRPPSPLLPSDAKKKPRLDGPDIKEQPQSMEEETPTAEAGHTNCSAKQ
jgi:hypothetical protein